MDPFLMVMMAVGALAVIALIAYLLFREPRGGQFFISGVGSYGRNAIPGFVTALKRHLGGAASILRVGVVDDNLGTNTKRRNDLLTKIVPRGRLYLPNRSMIKSPFGYRGSFRHALEEITSWRRLTQGMNDFFVGAAHLIGQLSPMDICFLGYTGGHLGPHIMTILERHLRLKTIIRVLVVALSAEPIRQRDMGRDPVLFRRLWETGVVATSLITDNNESMGEPDETRAARDEFVFNALAAFLIGPTQLTGQTTSADVFEKIGPMCAMSHSAVHMPVIPGSWMRRLLERLNIFDPRFHMDDLVTQTCIAARVAIKQQGWSTIDAERDPKGNSFLAITIPLRLKYRAAWDIVRERVTRQLELEYPGVTPVFSSAVVRGMPIDRHYRWHVQTTWLWELLAKKTPDRIRIQLQNPDFQPDEEVGMITDLLAGWETIRPPRISWGETEQQEPVSANSSEGGAS